MATSLVHIVPNLGRWLTDSSEIVKTFYIHFRIRMRLKLLFGRELVNKSCMLIIRLLVLEEVM